MDKGTDLPEAKLLDILNILTEYFPFSMAVIEGQSLKVKWANKSYLRLLEEPFKSKGVIGLSLEEFIPKSEYNKIFGLLDKVKKTKQPFLDHQYSHVVFERGITYWSLSLIPIFYQGEEVQDIFVFAMETTQYVQDRMEKEQLALNLEQECCRLKAVLDAMPIGVCLADEEGRIVETNENITEVWRGNVPKVKIPEYFKFQGWWADTGRPVEAEDWAMARAVSKGETSKAEVIEILRLDGTKGTILNSAAPIKDGNNNIIGGVAINQDITDQRMVYNLQKLALSDISIDDLVEQALESIHTLQDFLGKGKIILLNRAEENITVQVSSRDMDGKADKDVLTLPLAQFKGFEVFIEKGIKYHVNAEKGININTIPITSDDKQFGLIYLELQSDYRPNQAREELLVAVADILAGVLVRERAERELVICKQELEKLVAKKTAELAEAKKKLQQEVSEKELIQKNLVAANEKINNILNNISNFSFLALNHQWQIVYANNECAKNFRKSKEEIINKNIWDLYPEAIGTKLYDCLKRAMDERVRVEFKLITGTWYEAQAYPSDEGISVYFWDITDQKIWENKLHLAEEKFAKLFQLSSEMMCLVRVRDLQIIAVNESWSRAAGYNNSKEMEGKPLGQVSVFLTKKMVQELVAEFQEQGFIYKKEVEYFPANDEGIALISMSYVEVGKEKSILILLNDITECNNMQKRSRQLAAMVESSHDAIIGISKEGKIEAWNKGAEYLYGYKEEEVKGKNISIIVPAERKQEPMQNITKIIKGEEFSQFETIRVSREGNVIPVSINISPILDKNGQITALTTIHRDMSEQKRIEKELIRLDRLNLIGEMAAGISHEIRNPLTTVRGFLQLLARKKEYQKDEEHFKVMIDELDRANYIITEFLSLGKNQVVESNKKHNLNTIIKALIPLIQADALGSDTYVELELEDIPAVLVDEKSIRQVILNLSRNAIEAMEGGGVLTIRTYCTDAEVILAIRDEGKGIDPKIMEKLGTPFITTKNQGTGLGLAICYSIIDKHNGRITVDTDSNGTTFFVHFKKE